MTFKRKAYNKLLEWKTNSHGKTALIVEGARRVGKSTLVMEFIQKEYDDYLFLDFAKENDVVKENFKQNIGDLDVFFRTLFLAKGKDLKPNSNTAIVFDEVQLCPLARQAIKYLVADGRYDYIETGSLISIKRNKEKILIPSEEYKIKMFPMDFEEFLWATGDAVTFSAIRDAWNKKEPMGDKIHHKIMTQFRTYLAVGGMPQAVDSYVHGDTWKQIDFIKQTIISLYEDDLSSYDNENAEKSSILFKTIPEQLANHNSHFKFSLVEKSARYKNYLHSISFIAQSMIGNECIGVTSPEIDMEAYADKSNFKLYMGDTGLLVTLMTKSIDSADDLYKTIIFNKSDMNFGIVMENAVAQMMRTCGKDLYFHEFMYKNDGEAKEKKYEIDFLFTKKLKICPIEVKSSGYARHASFDNFKKKYHLKFGGRYIIYTKDLKTVDDIVYLPVYMTPCLFENFPN